MRDAVRYEHLLPALLQTMVDPATVPAVRESARRKVVEIMNGLNMSFAALLSSPRLAQHTTFAEMRAEVDRELEANRVLKSENLRLKLRIAELSADRGMAEIEQWMASDQTGPLPAPLEGGRYPYAMLKAILLHRLPNPRGWQAVFVESVAALGKSVRLGTLQDWQRSRVSAIEPDMIELALVMPLIYPLPHRWTNEQVDYVHDRIEAGWTDVQIANELRGGHIKVTSEAVRSFRKKFAAAERKKSAASAPSQKPRASEAA